MSTENQPIYLIAQNIRSLFNVGSLFRCADVFGVSRIYLCGYTGYPPRQQISKVALGADSWISWERHWQTHALIKKLKQQGIKMVALESGVGGKPLPDFKPTFPLAFIVGSETNGISQTVLKLVDEVVYIPMLGQKESLNVAVAASIVLYQLRN